MPANPILWTPSEQEIENSQIQVFQNNLEAKFSRKFGSYDQFQEWSVKEKDLFWKSWLETSGMIFEGAAEPVFVPNSNGEFFGGHWFPNLQLNYAQNLIDNFVSEKSMLVGMVEGGRKREFFKDEVKAKVARLQKYLRDHCGVKKGSIVAAFVPNCPETVICMLAVTSLGGVWSSCSTDFGEQGVLDRFEQIQPEVFFVADGVQYGGKIFDLAEKNNRIATALKKAGAPLRKILTIPHWNSESDLSKIWDGPDNLEPEYLKGEFQAPLFIMFSSGTTGRPKCIVHGAGGTLIQHLKEHKLHCNLLPGEKILYYTTCGWMMWNWLVSALACSSTVYCFDGSPAFPKASAIWKIVDHEKIEVFGTSAKFIGACRTMKLTLGHDFKFNHLRMVCSTGSPLLPEDFDYFYDQISHRERPIPVVSISGGTDIISCFMLGVPSKPVRRGEIQGFGLGMDVRALGVDGKSVIGEEGELVCGTPFPSMPTEFFKDPDSSKYRASYFEKYSGIWHHGDYVTVTPAHGVLVHGRSDATLNPGGVRIGTAEIYSHVETHPSVVDSLVVGRPNRLGDDEDIVLFVKMKSDEKFSREFVQDLKNKIKAGASPRHVPNQVYEVKEIPYTVSGKKVEIAVKKILQGRDPGNREALSNPAALDEYLKYRT